MNKENKKQEESKEIQYATVIMAAISDILDPNSESDNKIDFEILKDEKEATAFLHALANIVPTHFYRTLTGDDVDGLGFNHIANRLCFQFGKPEE